MTKSPPPMTVTPDQAFATEYDVAIVGSGVSGAIIARKLGEKGHRVLVIEAGSGRDITVGDYEESVGRFYTTVGKDNNAPYAKNPERADAARLRNPQAARRAASTT